MSNLIPFTFETSEIRVITLDDGDFMFSAKDVATALGYTNPSEAVSDHCKKAKSLKSLNNSKMLLSLEISDLRSDTKFIPQSDVYRLISRSKLESAERFQDWVFEDVIPAITKTGSYISPTLSSIEPDLPKKVTARVLKGAISMGDQLKEIRKRHGDDPTILALLSEAIGLNITTLATQKPKSVIPDANDEYIESDENYLTVTELGKKLQESVSAQTMNLVLKNMGFQFREEETREWRMTPEGSRYGRYFYVQFEQTGGVGEKRTLKWHIEILSQIDESKIKFVK